MSTSPRNLLAVTRARVARARAAHPARVDRRVDAAPEVQVARAAIVVLLAHLLNTTRKF